MSCDCQCVPAELQMRALMLGTWWNPAVRGAPSESPLQLLQQHPAADRSGASDQAMVMAAWDRWHARLKGIESNLSKRAKSADTAGFQGKECTQTWAACSAVQSAPIAICQPSLCMPESA